MTEIENRGIEQERRVLQNRCSVVGRELTRLLAEYADVLRDCPTVDMQLRKAGSRAHEYENGTFIVLVVGPVKSGKSTVEPAVGGGA